MLVKKIINIVSVLYIKYINNLKQTKLRKRACDFRQSNFKSNLSSIKASQKSKIKIEVDDFCLGRTCTGS